MSKPNLICEICGKDYYRRPWQIKKFKTLACSRKCHLELKVRRNTLGNCVCENCGKNYRTNSAYIRRTPNQKRFCSVSCHREYLQKSCHYGIGVEGYRFTRIKGKSVRVHRLIMENKLGRKLTPQEHVNHINGDKLNNRLDNLEVLSHSEHMRLHGLINHIRKTKLVKCYRCGEERRIRNGYIKTKYKGDLSKLEKWCCNKCHYYYTSIYGVGYKNKI